jgi:hypothetical protein
VLRGDKNPRRDCPSLAKLIPGITNKEKTMMLAEK